jgi:hypothetical protein
MRRDENKAQWQYFLLKGQTAGTSMDKEEEETTTNGIFWQ